MNSPLSPAFQCLVVPGLPPDAPFRIFITFGSRFPMPRCIRLRFSKVSQVSNNCQRHYGSLTNGLRGYIRGRGFDSRQRRPYFDWAEVQKTPVYFYWSALWRMPREHKLLYIFFNGTTLTPQWVVLNTLLPFLFTITLSTSSCGWPSHFFPTCKPACHVCLNCGAIELAFLECFAYFNYVVALLVVVLMNSCR